MRNNPSGPKLFYHLPMIRIGSLYMLLFLLPETVYCQYVLRLPDASWNVVPARYHLERVVDDRKEKDTAGEIIRGSQKSQIRFDRSVEEALYLHVCSGLKQDSSHTAGLELHIDRFRLRDLDNNNKHTITLDMKLRMVRPIEGTFQTLFEQESKPSYTIIGPDVSEIPVRLATQSIRSFFLEFDKWATNHPDQPWFMNHTAVELRSHAQKFYGSKDTILWSPSYRLVWSDFKGKAPVPSPYSAQSNCLYTLSSIPRFSTDTMYLTVRLHPCFTRDASWVESSSKQDSLLQHEQLHFDLCELYGRRFRKAISEKKFSLLDYDKELNSLFRQVWDDYRKAQDNYDAETRHGIITEMQETWRRTVETDLEKLSEFSTQ
jgi:hypothetical protein